MVLKSIKLYNNSSSENFEIPALFACRLAEKEAAISKFVEDKLQGVLAARGIWGKEKTVNSKIRELQGLFSNKRGKQLFNVPF